METPASIARHPIHPILITIPVGLWVFSLVCDVVVLFSDVGEVELVWFMLAYYTIAGGLVGAVVAAIPGLFDFLSLRNRHLRKLASTHLAINLSVVVLYAINLWLRSAEPPNFLIGMGMSVLGVTLIAISGWLGGEMVHVHGVGVAGIPAPIDDVSDHEATHTGPSATRLGPT